MSGYWARGKFGKHERGVRVPWGTGENNFSLLSALQTFEVLNISTYAQLKHELIVKRKVSFVICSDKYITNVGTSMKRSH